MVEVFGASIPTPDWSFGFNSSVVWLLVVIFLIVILGVVAFFVMRHLLIYNKKIVVFENISGQGYQPVFKDRARLIKLGDGGEEILFLMKKKVFRTAYGRKMGKNTYWFAIGQDGYWYNVVLGDVDAKMGMLDIEPIDRDMRYMHVAIRKNIQDRYKKVNAWEKYGTYIMSGLFMIIMIIGIWLLLDQIAQIAATTSENIQASQKVADATNNILQSLDNICGGASFKSAGT